MFEKALVCTDLSEESDRLIGCTGQLRALGVREAVLAHAIDVFATSGRSRSDDETFERQCRLLESAGIRVTIELPVGQPAFSLREVAERHATTLTLLASGGAGSTEADFSGSASSNLVLLSESPVLVSPSRALGDEQKCSLVCSRLLGRILYATDFSAASESAFDALRQVARFGAQEIVLLHVQDRRRLAEEGRRDHIADCDRTDAERLLGQKRLLSASSAARVTTEILYGDACEEISRRAGSGDYTMLVLGSGERTADTGALGKTTRLALRSSACPVLIVPSPCVI